MLCVAYALVSFTKHENNRMLFFWWWLSTLLSNLMCTITFAFWKESLPHSWHMNHNFSRILLIRNKFLLRIALLLLEKVTLHSNWSHHRAEVEIITGWFFDFLEQRSSNGDSYGMKQMMLFYLWLPTEGGSNIEFFRSIQIDPFYYSCIEFVS